MVCPEGLAASISAAAAAIARGRTAEELGLLSSVFNQLGDTLGTIAAARALCDFRQQKDAARQEEAAKGDGDTKEQEQTEKAEPENR